MNRIPIHITPFVNTNLKFQFQNRPVKSSDLIIVHTLKTTFEKV